MVVQGLTDPVEADRPDSSVDRDETNLFERYFCKSKE